MLVYLQNAFISNMRVILLLKFNEYLKIQRKLKNPTFTIKKEKCYRGQIIPRRQLELYDMVLKIGEYRNTAIFERVYDKKKRPTILSK